MTEVERILGRTLRGTARNVKRRLAHAASIEAIIQVRWHVKPWSWQLKHVEWFFDAHARDWSARMRYEAWRNIRAVLVGVGKAHLVAWLVNRRNADYLRPDGAPGRLSRRGRPPLLVVR